MAGYKRTDTTNNIATGNVINASDLDNEYDAIQAAFHETTGHTHDGDLGEGSPITRVGPAQDVVVSAAAVTPKTDNTMDLGSPSLEFKDLYIDGTANIDSLVADTADINGGTVDGAVIGGSTAAAGTFTTATATTGNITTVNSTTVDTTNLEVTNIKAKDGTASATIADSTGVMTVASAVLTTADINGGTIDGAVIGGASAAAGNFTTLGATGVATFSAGTVSAPAITTTGDTNTGIFFPAADTIAFTEGGVESMRITSAGNVGIGTSSPATLLTVSGAGSTGLLTVNRTDGSGFISINSSNGVAGAQIGSTGAQGLQFYTNFSTSPLLAMQILSSGNVGIGTSSPSSTLQVLTDGTAVTADAGTVGLFQRSSLTSSGAIVSVIGGNAGSSSINLGDTDSQSVGRLRYEHSTNSMQFITNSAERMRITSTGAVGIGTTSPTAARLQVTGTGTTALSSVQNTDSFAGGTNFTQPHFAIGSGNDTTGNVTRLGFGVGTGAQVFLDALMESSVTVYSSLLFRTRGADSVAERMRITSAGNVGIGTSSPAAKFVVSNAGAGGIEMLTDGTIQSYNRSTSAYQTLRLDGSILLFRPSGTEAMRIDSGGKVGIGLTSYSLPLSVVADANGQNVQLNGRTGDDFGQIFFRNFGGSNNIARIASDSNAALIFGTGIQTAPTVPTERMRITSAGRVSVGTTEANRILNAYESETTTNSSTSFWNATYAGIYLRNTSDTTNVLTGIGFSSGSSGLSASGIANVAESLSLGALAFYTGGQGISNTVPERMRITSTGRVGIGTTTPGGLLEVFGTPPSSTGSVGLAVSDGTRSGQLQITGSAYSYNGVGANEILLYAGGGALSFLADGQPIKFCTGGERMRIDTSGNVGIGTSSPSSYNANAKLVVVSGSTAQTWVVGGSAAGAYTFFSNNAQTVLTNAFQIGQGWATGSDNIGFLNTNGANPLLFATNSSERMRIDSSGRILAGTTATFGGANSVFNAAADCAGAQCFAANNTNTGAVSQYVIPIYRNGSLTGGITNTDTATGFATSSDYRLKENIAPMTGALAKVAALKPVTYKWKTNGSDGQGFIAHELQSVVPDCVTGEKDAVDAEGKPVYQGIDTSFLVATLTAAIQELKATVDAQAARIAALESK